MSYVELARQFLAKRKCQTSYDVDDLRECFEERAGMMEYDGHLPRHGAERAALGCMPVQIDWPQLPNGDLTGAALDAAWATFWNLVEGQLKANAHAN
jgi:hypothetical protein